MIAPKDESGDLVMQWIEGEDLAHHTTISPRSDSVIVEGSIAQIEKLLKSEYNTFGNAFSFGFQQPELYIL
jgi:tripeptidyl-peptidase I